MALYPGERAVAQGDRVRGILPSSSSRIHHFDYPYSATLNAETETASAPAPITLFSRCAENLSKALTPEQMLIAVTGIGAGDSRGHGGFLYDYVFHPIVLRRIYADKDRQERIIMSTLTRWIIVRPGFLTNGPCKGRYRALTDLLGIRGGKISRADVADFMLSQAKSPRFIGQAPLLIY